MSTTKRLISGTAASWFRIIITMIAQLILVPIYLSYWNTSTYGLWLAVQAFLSILVTIDHGHQNFLEFEFLKISKENNKQISIVLWSGVLIGILLGLLVVIVTICFIIFGFLPFFIGNGNETITVGLLREAGYVLIILSIVNLLTASAGGIYVRALSPFGYYSRMSWWGVWATILTTFAPVIAVINGASFLTTGIVLSVATIVYNIPMLFDIFSLFKRENIVYEKISLSLGWKNFVLSLILSFKELLENLRQQGVRVVLVPVLGAAGLTAFSTMRTGANIALQGLNTITSPLMPELMRFLNEKDQTKMEASFSTVWLILIMFLSPGVTILQAFIEPFFNIWTKGHIKFNPTLFAILSLGVLVYAISQPAIAVVRGNNLVKPQLYISILASAIVVGGILLLVPIIGVIGVGISLLISEIIACVGYTIVAKRWLISKELKWPYVSSLLAISSVSITAIIMLMTIYFPIFKIQLLLIGVFILIGNAAIYWKLLPDLIKYKAKNLKLFKNN